MGCVNTKRSLKKYNGIFKNEHLIYYDIIKETLKFRNQQKINSYSLFFVDSNCTSPSGNIQFEKDQILLVDLSSYYSLNNIRVWDIKLIINKESIKLVIGYYNSMINKYRLNKLNLN
jgi:hypothetical protein